MWRKVIVFIASSIAVVALLGWLGYMILDKPVPTGKAGPDADALAHNMETALHRTAWDSTRWIKWSFPGDRHYVWDKATHWVRVRTGKYTVDLFTQKLKQSRVVKPIHGTDAKRSEYIADAWKAFCNDSYWLIAPYKTFDTLVVREKTANGELLVTYPFGGVTPGDAYCWTLNSEYQPTDFRMWVSIIPVGGIRATWEGYDTTATGAVIATKHRIAGLYTLHIDSLVTAFDFTALGYEKDPFLPYRP